MFLISILLHFLIIGNYCLVFIVLYHCNPEVVKGLAHYSLY